MVDAPGEWTEEEVASEATGCSPREQYLCIMYRLTGDLAEAGRLAGYQHVNSPRDAMYRKPVQAFLQKIRTGDLRLAAERLALRLEWLTDATVFDVLEEAEDGAVQLRKLSDLTRAQRYGIKRLQLTPREQRGSGKILTSIQIEVEDRLTAMKLSAALQQQLAEWAARQPHPENDTGEPEAAVFSGAIPLIGREIDVERYAMASGVPQALEEQDKAE